MEQSDAILLRPGDFFSWTNSILLYFYEKLFLFQCYVTSVESLGKGKPALKKFYREIGYR